MGKNQHVTPNPNGGWQVKGEGNTRATALTSTQAEAIEIATNIARSQQSELFIHGKDGRMLAPGRNDQIGLSKNRQKRFRRNRQTTMCIIEIKQTI